MSDSLRPHGLYGSWNSPGQNTGVGGLFLRQGIFPTQGSNPGLPHCRRSLYQLSPQGSPHKYVQLISDKGEKAIQWRIAFSINDAEATGKKSESQSKSHTLYKHELKMNHELKYKVIKHLEKKLEVIIGSSAKQRVLRPDTKSTVHKRRSL